MLVNWRPHKEYQINLKLKLLYHMQIQKSRLAELDRTISKLYLLNLDNLLPVIKPLYPDLGRPAKNQQGILRSLVMMLDLGKHSITNWASMIGGDPLLSDICGFDSPNIPSPSSYYDLLVRLWLANHKTHIDRKLKLRSFYYKPRKKLKAGQKLPPKHSGSVKRLVDKALQGKLHDFRTEKILQEFLARCVVDTSASMGLLGDINNLSVAFDGSSYYSGASHYGVKVCDCRSKGTYNCTCKRRYSDPDATWGWDSYRERWYYGDTLFNVTASDSPNDLPIYLRIVQASRHDSITTVFALRDIHNMYTQISFKNFLADGAMDNYPTYELLKSYDMLPFIALDSRTKAKFNYPHKDILCFDGKGRPICLGGIPYVYWGFCKPYRLKYRCWFAVHGIEPPKECKCSNSGYGKTIYIKSDHDPRMFTPIPRYSQSFKDKFKTRTSVERSNKRVFIDYSIEEAHSRSSMMRFSMATFAVINIHLDAWIKSKSFSLIQEIKGTSA